MAQRKGKKHQALDKHAVTVHFIVVSGVGCVEFVDDQKKQRISQGFKCFIAGKIRQDSQNVSNQIQVMINCNYPLEEFNSTTDLYLTLQEDHFI